MVTETRQGGLGERKLAGASKGIAVSTTAAFTGLYKGTKHIQLTARNFSTAVVVGYAINPFLIIIKTQDSLATATDYSEEAQDLDTGTSVVLNAQGTAAQGDFLYVGSHTPFRGVSIDVDGTNGNASVLTVKYRKSDNTWADISATDNTASGGNALAQDGTVVWTMPTDWIPTTLIAAGDAAKVGAPVWTNTELYWTRWQWSAALDAAVSLDHMLSMNRSTAYAEMVAGTFDEEANWGPFGVGNVEAVTDAGTANLLLNCFAGPGKRFP